MTLMAVFTGYVKNENATGLPPVFICCVVFFQVWQLVCRDWQPPGLMGLGKASGTQSAVVSTRRHGIQIQKALGWVSSIWPLSVLLTLGRQLLALMHHAVIILVRVHLMFARIQDASLDNTGIKQATASMQSQSRGTLTTIVGTLQRFYFLSRLFRAELHVLGSSPTELQHWALPLHVGLSDESDEVNVRKPQPSGELVALDREDTVGSFRLLNCLSTVRCEP